MEISPISGIREMPVLKARAAGPELAALSNVEELAQIGDETYTPSRKESAGDAEDGDEELIDAPESEERERAGTDDGDSVSGTAVSFFA